MRWRVALLAGMLLGAGATVMPAVATATPTMGESFSPGSIPLAGTATLTFTITGADTVPPTVSFDDMLPTGLSLIVGSQGTTCAGVTSGGSNDLGFTGTAPLPGATCTVSGTVEGTHGGAWDNFVSANTDINNSISADASIDVVAPPSISAAFGTSLLGLDGTTSLTLTITNPNQSFALSGVGFTDTFPAGLVIAGQPTNTCGGSVAGDPGSNNLGLSDGQLSPSSSCTVSATITATATGALTDTTTQVFSAEGGIGNSASAGLTVVGAPTISLLSPLGGHRYTFGQRVRADYSCADDPNGPGISSCAGDVANGSLINTSKAGLYTFTVTAKSRDGGIGTEIAFYSVAPDNRFKVRRVHAASDGSIDFTVRVPGAGTVTVLESAGPGSHRFARGQANARRTGKIRLTVRPNASGRLAVQQGHVKRVSVTVEFTPRGGTRATKRLSVAV